MPAEEMHPFALFTVKIHRPFDTGSDGRCTKKSEQTNQREGTVVSERPNGGSYYDEVAAPTDSNVRSVIFQGFQISFRRMEGEITRIAMPFRRY